jgi:alpha-beta hydrolase superfamily lysophospholipase
MPANEVGEAHAAAPGERLLSRDGVGLHLQRWPVAAPRGSVLVVHGLGEHIGRYAHVAARLNAAGWSVAGHDQRGHGRSDGARGALHADDDLLFDLAQVIDEVRNTLPSPLLLLGHSMGGVVAARFVAGGRADAWWREVDALVLSSPALDPGLGAMQKLLLALAGRIAPNLALSNGLKPEWISRDANVVQRYVADPRVHDRVTARLVRFMVDGGRFVQQRALHWRVPTLLLYAGSDRCVVPGGSAAFAAAAPAGCVTTREFAPLFHEIFNEPEQASVFAELEAWLAERFTRPPGAHTNSRPVA